MNNGTTSAWTPLSIPVFRALWLATLVSNIGTWMHDIGAGWLMTSLSPSPMMVALVQTATMLPVFLLALPAGALADIIDKRRHLIRMQLFMALVAACLAAVTLFGVVTPEILLGLTFAMGIGSAMMMPAWASIVPELVPRSELPSAIVLNSMGINVARAIGPAIAGVIIAYAGSGAVFLLNALSFVGVIMVLKHWTVEPPVSQLPTERWFSAMRQGMRYARHEPRLHSIAFRGIGFFLFASAAWALLPLVAKHIPSGGPQAYGILMASIGAGAVTGALVLPRLRSRLSTDGLVAAASVLYAICLVALASFEHLWLLAVAMAFIGMAWITVLSSVQVAAQMALPNWVRSRGLALIMSVFMGSMALGSLIWGKVADVWSIQHALIFAAVGIVVAVFITWRWSIEPQREADSSLAADWPAPPVVDGAQNGPVLVTIEYIVDEKMVAPFIRLLYQLAVLRKRDGAFGWGLFEHAEKSQHFIETFHNETWLAHLRTHERVSADVKHLQSQIRTCLVEKTQPATTHYIAPNLAQNKLREKP